MYWFEDPPALFKIRKPCRGGFKSEGGGGERVTVWTKVDQGEEWARILGRKSFGWFVQGMFMYAIN